MQLCTDTKKENSMSDITRTVGPNKAKAAIRHAMKKQRPVFLWGPPGIGKSDTIHQIGEMIEAHVIDIRLSLWEPTDIKGIPYFNSNENNMLWAPPVELPSAAMAAEHKHIILFLDEMNAAAPSVQAAAYQLILNRKVGTYVLPDNVMIVAAGNRESDKGVTYRMPAPLANRFVHLEMAVSFDDWFEWAIDNSIHKDVVGFLSYSKADLNDFNPKSASRAFATPRSWSFVSELLDDGIDLSTTTDLIAGAIGEGLAIKFMAHRKIAGAMPNPVDVLSGKVKKMKTSEISAMYSLTIALCYELKEASDKADPKYNQMIDHYLRFTMDNFEPELVVMGIRIALSQYGLLIDSAALTNFDEFRKRYETYIHQSHG
jgi:hypothetical protein